MPYTIKLGSFTSKAWLLKLPIPEPYDVLLGDVWLKYHKVRILYDKLALEIVTLKRRFTVKARKAPKPADYSPAHPAVSDVRILQFMDVKHAIQTKQEMHLLFVQREEPADPIDEDESTPPASDVPGHLKIQLNNLLDEYDDIFGNKLHQTAPIRENMPEVVPIIPGSKPSNRPLYRYSPAEVNEIEKQVKAMLEQNLIEHSTSPYGAPVLLVVTRYRVPSNIGVTQGPGLFVGDVVYLY